MECRVRALAFNDFQKLSEIEAILAPMTRLPLTDDVFERTAFVRAQTSLKTPDALHVATALVHGCGELWTADARMAKVAVPGLAIRLVA